MTLKRLMPVLSFFMLLLIALLFYAVTLLNVTSVSGKVPLSSTATATLPPPTVTASPTLTPSPTPRPTLTPFPSPTPTTTPTPTPDFPLETYLDLGNDEALRAALCRSDRSYKPSEGQVLVPILLYHFVGREALEASGRTTTRYNVTKADFETQLALLDRLGYHAVTVSEIADAIEGQAELPERPIAITVDDGWIEQYTNIFPLLQKYNFCATFYIPSSYPIGNRLVTWEQLKEMADAGMEIGSHTCKHVDLTVQTPQLAWREIYTSRLTLEARLGVTVTSFSYPYANYNASVIELLKKANYRSAVAMGTLPIQGLNNRYAMNRIEIFGDRDLLDFIRRLPWLGEGTSLCNIDDDG